MDSCARCGIEKPFTEEYYYRRKPGQLYRVCKVCVRAASREAGAKRTAAKAPRAFGPMPNGLRICRCCLAEKTDKEFATFLRYGGHRIANECLACKRERGRREKRKRYAERREQVLASNKRWKAANPDKAHRAVRDWHKRHPEAKRVEVIKRRARAKNAAGTFTRHDIHARGLKQGHRCFYCAALLGRYEVDHFVPIARGGSNEPSNLVLACPACNNSKNAKLPWEWMPDRFKPGSVPRQNSEVFCGQSAQR